MCPHIISDTTDSWFIKRGLQFLTLHNLERYESWWATISEDVEGIRLDPIPGKSQHLPGGTEEHRENP